MIWKNLLLINYRLYFISKEIEVIKIRIIESIFPVDNHSMDIFQHIPHKDILIFDIETTGFSRINSKVILIGFVEISDKKGKITQLFCDSLSEEFDILKHFEKKIREYKYYMTYNGDAFDIPYLNERYSNNNINFKINKSRNIDMLCFARKHIKKLNLENYKLKTVETLLGISRSDTINGKESIELYFKYLKYKNTKDLDKILLHNNEDIKNMYPLLKLCNYLTTEDLISFLPKDTNIFNSNYIIKSYSIGEYLEIELDAGTETNEISINSFDYTINIKNYSGYLKIPLIKLNISNSMFSFIDIEKLSNLKFSNLDKISKLEFLISKGNHIIPSNLKNIETLIKL